MDSLLITILLRMVERIGDVIIGGLAIYFGYTLFLRTPDLKNSQGELKWGDISVILSRIGPGVFFALFGVTVTVVSLYRGVTYEPFTSVSPIFLGTTVASNLTPTPLPSGAFSGVGESQSKPTVSAPDTLSIRGNIAILNSVDGKLETGLSEKDKRDLDLALPRIKLAMMESIWNDKEWGDQPSFRQKILDNGIDCTKPDKKPAIEFYCYGTQGGS